MDNFPSFMRNKLNLVPTEDQNTKDIEGYYFQGADGSQVVFWTCHSDQVSAEHCHQFDEYMICVSGQFTVHVEKKTHVLNPGDELHIQKGRTQWGEVRAGTRSIHVFGGLRLTTK